MEIDEIELIESDLDDEENDPSFVLPADEDQKDCSEEDTDDDALNRKKGRKRGRKEKKQPPPEWNCNVHNLHKAFSKFVKESSKTRKTEDGQIVPSRFYANKTERSAGRAHTKVVLTEFGANIRCHNTDVFKLQGDEIVLDTWTYPSDSTKDSINIGLRMMGDLRTGGGLFIQQKNFDYLLNRGYFDDSNQYQCVTVATVGNKRDGGAFLRMSASTGEVLQVTQNPREIMPYEQRVVLNFIACHRFHRKDCGLLAKLPREIVQMIARELFQMIRK